MEAGRIHDFPLLLERFTAPERSECAATLLAAASGPPRFGFVLLLDPDGELMTSREALPEHCATFLLAPAAGHTVLEILAGPKAATYVFAEGLERVNQDLQALHFRRALLALTEEQARVSRTNPHRLALRRLEPLLRLRACKVGRLVHGEGWPEELRATLA